MEPSGGERGGGPGTGERRSLLRIIDASRNRAAEALRVAEDVCRFHFGLEGFARELRELRHEVLARVDALPALPGELLASRDIEGDVGRGAPSAAGSMGNAALVGSRNIERAREAIRSLEEASRSAFPAAAGVFDEVRYRLYAIEKGMSFLGTEGRRTASSRLDAVRVCLLAGTAATPRPLVDVVEEAVRAGAGMVQLREKDAGDREVLRRARAVREVTARLGALFIVNDRPDIAILAHADGVHLGQADLPPAAARSLLGDGYLIGASTHSAAEIRAAEREAVDYVGVGPVFPSPTKDAGPPIGPDGLRGLLSLTHLPAFAIGGIGPANASEAARAGAKRVAMGSSILGSSDPGKAIRDVLGALRSNGE